MRARKVGRWCVRLAVVSALGAAVFSQTPVASAAVEVPLTFITDLSTLGDPTPTPTPSPSSSVFNTEEYEWR